MIINTNMASINALRNLSISGGSMQKSLEKLSSGFRINRAADDAAGLAISEKMRGQIRGLNQAQRNAQDGISLLQTAEGGLSEVHNILQRMRELSVEAANDSLDDTSDRPAVQTEMTQLITEIGRINTSTKFNGKAIFQDFTTIPATFQIGADTGGDQILDVTIDTMDTAGLGKTGVDIAGVDVSTLAGAQAAITTISDAIVSVAATRAQVGAYQNRLENAAQNLAVGSENLTAAESRIRDVDMASAMSEFTKNNILNQAGVAMLAQANQAPQAVLKLLG